MSLIKNLLTRATVKLVNAKTKLQQLQLGLFFGELKGDVEHFEPYGFTTHPHPNSEALAAFFGGDRSHGIVLAVADRRYRITTLKEGEVALYDDLGQTVILRRSGIEVTTPLNFTATVDGDSKIKTSSLLIDCPTTHITGTVLIDKLLTGKGGLAISGGSGATVTGNVNASGDVKAGGISLQNHTHPGDSGGTTGKAQ